MNSNNHYQRAPYRMPPAMLIDKYEEVDDLRHALRDVKRIAVDTESNGLFAYRAQVCLIQISTDYEDFLIDPLTLKKGEVYNALNDVFADPAVEKILHAAEYDVMTLRHDFGFEFVNIFDTMLAARVLAWESTGLGSILSDHYAIKLNKRHQRANWGKRPLPMAMLRYAQMDTHFLPDLRDKQYALLAEKDRLEEAVEMFDEVCYAKWSNNGFDPEGYWKIRGTRHLSPQEMAILRELYLYREELAEAHNVPPFKIMGDKTLLAITEIAPQRIADLGAVEGVSSRLLNGFGEAVIQAIHRGRNAPPPESPHKQTMHQSDIIIQRRYEMLRAWRKQRGVARGVPSDVIISREAMWEIARKAPETHEALSQVKHLGPWRAKTYGDEILDVVEKSQDH